MTHDLDPCIEQAARRVSGIRSVADLDAAALPVRPHTYREIVAELVVLAEENYLPFPPTIMLVSYHPPHVSITVRSQNAAQGWARVLHVDVDAGAAVPMYGRLCGWLVSIWVRAGLPLRVSVPVVESGAPPTGADRVAAAILTPDDVPPLPAGVEGHEIGGRQ